MRLLLAPRCVHCAVSGSVCIDGVSRGRCQWRPPAVSGVGGACSVAASSSQAEASEAGRQ